MTTVITIAITFFIFIISFLFSVACRPLFFVYGHSVAQEVSQKRHTEKRKSKTPPGTYPGSVSRIEDKQRTVTDIELYGLAKVLGVSIEKLFEK